MFDHLSLETGPAETEWHRAIVSGALAAATDSEPLRLVLLPDTSAPPSSRPASGAWRDSERRMARAVQRPQALGEELDQPDLRDEGVD
jgi:hypothetical protein